MRGETLELRLAAGADGDGAILREGWVRGAVCVAEEEGYAALLEGIHVTSIAGIGRLASCRDALSCITFFIIPKFEGHVH